MSGLRNLNPRGLRRAALAGAAAVGVAGLLAACGGSSSGSSHKSTGGGGSSSTLVVAMPEDLTNFDPTLSTGDQTTQEMMTNVYSWLDNYAPTTVGGRIEGDPNKFVGGLAASLSWNSSRTVLTFHLRHGLKFANGDPLDAAAVKFSYDRVFKQKAVTAALIGMAAVKNQNSITTKGRYTVQFHQQKPNTLLLGNIAQFGNSILDPKVVAAHATKSDPYAHTWLSSHVGGGADGPYELQSWQQGSQWVFVANPNYYGPAPKMKKIIFKVIPDASTRYELLQSGAVDIAFNLPLKDVKAAQSNPAIHIYNDPSRNIVFLGMNNKMKPFDNVKVRQAIDYAVPYDTILKQVLLGYGQKMTSPVPIGTPTHTGKYDPYTTNPAKAKQLLTQAGYPHGFSTTLEVASGNAEGQETAIWVEQALAKIGIKVTIQQLPGSTYTSKLQAHQLGFFFFNNWISINNDPFYHLYWMFDSTCCDYANYHNATVSKLINRDLVSSNMQQRAADSLKIQQIVMQQAPWAFLYQPNWVVATRADVKGYRYFPADTFTRYQYIYKTGG